MKRKIIFIDEELCTGCGECIPSCAEGALQIINGKAKVIADRLCDGLGACLGHCPTGALKLIEREAEPFSEEEVKKRLATKSCPSTKQVSVSSEESFLPHWPIQIPLVPSQAPFFKSGEVYIFADCVPPAWPDFFKLNLKNKAVLLGCPKLSNTVQYLEKFQEIIRHNELGKITLFQMEVPCCAGLLALLKEALKRENKEVEIEVKIISRTGKEVQTPLEKKLGPTPL